MTAVIAAVLAFLFRIPLAAMIVCGIAAFLLVAGLWMPTVFRRIERAVGALAAGVGVLLTWVLLLPLFYLVFTPGRLILKVRGKDPLRREFPGSDTTFWIPHRSRTDEADYRKQF